MENRRIVVEPRARRTARARDTGSTASLPTDILQDQCTRQMLLYAVGAAVWTTGLVMHRWVLPTPDKSVHGLVIDVAAIVASLAVLAYTRFSP